MAGMVLQRRCCPKPDDLLKMVKHCENVSKELVASHQRAMFHLSPPPLMQRGRPGNTHHLYPKEQRHSVCYQIPPMI